MPAYDKQCAVCGFEFVHVAPIDYRECGCPRCDGPTMTVFNVAPAVQSTKEFICDDIDGSDKVITSKKHMREVLKEHNETHPGDHLVSPWADGNPLAGSDGKPEAAEKAPLKELREFREKKKEKELDKDPQRL